MSWKPFQVVATREQAVEAARWLHDRLAGVPEPGRKAIPEITRERALRPQLERLLDNWDIGEAELGPAPHQGA